MKTLILLTVLLSFSCTKETIKTVVVEKQVSSEFETFEKNNIYGGYKSYVALISQTGTTSPSVIVLENNLGNIVWSRSYKGSYRGTLSNAFTLDKTYIVFPTNGYLNETLSLRLDSNNIALESYIYDSLEDGFNTTIEIRVYY